MELIKPGTVIDFMRYRKGVISFSMVLVVLSLVSIFVPGPNYGIDFAGGTEVQLAFEGDVSTSELRELLQKKGYKSPDVVAVQGEKSEFLIRLQEDSSLPAGFEETLNKELAGKLESISGGAVELRVLKVSPGGDKLSAEFSAEVNADALKAAVEGFGTEVRTARRFGKVEDHRYEIQLVGVADMLVKQLRDELGARGPGEPLRVEWVGPKAGAQLRDAAVKSLLYAIAFIMVYVAFRFDLRFAPGGVLAMMHDAIITVGVYVLFQREVNLTTIAALLTIVGYSINDTIVVYDRIRENMARMKDKSLRELINISTSQMLARTLVTSGTTLMSVTMFFIYGTDVIQDIAFALMIGFVIGTYSSIYIAAPATEWMDRKFFSKEAAS